MLNPSTNSLINKIKGLCRMTLMHIHSFRLILINCILSRFRQNIRRLVKGYVLLRFIAT